MWKILNFKKPLLIPQALIIFFHKRWNFFLSSCKAYLIKTYFVKDTFKILRKSVLRSLLALKFRNVILTTFLSFPRHSFTPYTYTLLVRFSLLLFLLVVKLVIVEKTPALEVNRLQAANNGKTNATLGTAQATDQINELRQQLQREQNKQVQNQKKIKELEEKIEQLAKQLNEFQKAQAGNQKAAEAAKSGEGDKGTPMIPPSQSQPPQSNNNKDDNKNQPPPQQQPPQMVQQPPSNSSSSLQRGQEIVRLPITGNSTSTPNRTTQSLASMASQIAQPRVPLANVNPSNSTNPTSTSGFQANTLSVKGSASPPPRTLSQSSGPPRTDLRVSEWSPGARASNNFNSDHVHGLSASSQVVAQSSSYSFVSSSAFSASLSQTGVRGFSQEDIKPLSSKRTSVGLEDEEGEEDVIGEDREKVKRKKKKRTKRGTNFPNGESFRKYAKQFFGSIQGIYGSSQGVGLSTVVSGSFRPK